MPTISGSASIKTNASQAPVHIMSLSSISKRHPYAPKANPVVT